MGGSGVQKICCSRVLGVSRHDGQHEYKVFMAPIHVHPIRMYTAFRLWSLRHISSLGDVVARPDHRLRCTNNANSVADKGCLPTRRLPGVRCLRARISPSTMHCIGLIRSSRCSSVVWESMLASVCIPTSAAEHSCCFSVLFYRPVALNRGLGYGLARWRTVSEATCLMRVTSYRLTRLLVLGSTRANPI